jgi:hypothetical protein
MDPVTAALNLVTQILKTIEVFWTSMTPEQQQRTVQWHINNLEFWQKLLDKAGK